MSEVKLELHKLNKTHWLVPPELNFTKKTWIRVDPLPAKIIVHITIEGWEVTLCAHCLKKRYNFSESDLKQSSKEILRTINEKALLLLNYIKVVSPLFKTIYPSRVWFEQPFIATLQFSEQVISKNHIGHFGRRETKQPFSLTVTPHRIYFHTKNRPHSSSFKTISRTFEILSRTPFLRLAPLKMQPWEFDGEYSVYLDIFNAHQQGKNVSGLTIPYCTYAKITSANRLKPTVLIKESDSTVEKNLRTLTHCQKRKIAHLVACALMNLHALNWIHGDLKGANVGLDSNGQIRLFDFGIAQRIDEKEKLGGTVGYLSPEFLKKGPHDLLKVEAFALGAFIIEMIMGGPPFWEQDKNLEEGFSKLKSWMYDIEQHPKSHLFTTALKLLDDNPETRMSIKEAAEALRF